MEDTVTLQIHRSAYIERDSDVALIRLDTMNHLEGQPVMINYYGRNGEVETITAVGIKNGVGKDCYSIVSTSHEETVNYITEDLPDVSVLVNGAIYISIYTGVWSKVYYWGDEIRRVDPLDPETSVVYKDLSTGYRWFWNRGRMYREDDFLDLSGLAETIANLELPGDLTSYFLAGSTQLKGTTITSPEIFVQVTKNGHDITNECNIKILNAQEEEQIIKSIEGNIVTIYSTLTKDTTFKIVTTIHNEYTGADEVLESYIEMKFVPYTIYGTTIDTDNKSDAILGLMRPKNILWNGVDDLVLDFGNLDLYRTMILIPDAFSYPNSIKDRNGLDYIDDYDKGTVTFEEETYKTLLKKDAVTINNFKQILCYE